MFLFVESMVGIVPENCKIYGFCYVLKVWSKSSREHFYQCYIIFSNVAEPPWASINLLTKITFHESPYPNDWLFCIYVLLKRTNLLIISSENAVNFLGMVILWWTLIVVQKVNGRWWAFKDAAKKYSRDILNRLCHELY